MQTGLDRPERCADPGGNLVEREVRPVVKNDDHALVWIERSQPAEQGIPLGDGAEWVRWHGRIDARIERDEADRPAATKPVAAAVHENAVEPRLEALDVSNRAHRAPRSQQRVLDRVLGFESIPQDQPCQAIGAVQVATSELQEAGVGVVQPRVVGRSVKIGLGSPR